MISDDHNMLGTAQLEKGEYDEAILEFTKAIQSVALGFADAHYKRSVAYYHKGEYDLAIADATKAIVANPSHAEAHYNRGLA